MKWRMLLLCTAVLAGACHKDDPAAAGAAALAPKPAVKLPAKSGPTASEQTADMVEAAGQGKSPLAVELKFELAQRPKVGQPLPINLALLPQTAGSSATVQLTSSEGITVAPGDNQFEVPAVDAGEVYRHSVTVTPGAEGVLLLGVTVALKHDELTEQKEFVIPLITDR